METSQAETLTNAIGFDNLYKRLLVILTSALLILYANLCWSQTITVAVEVDSLVGATETYLYEFSDNPNFTTILGRQEAVGGRVEWIAPQEGVYHWRAKVVRAESTPPATQSDGTAEVTEKSAIASGSFVALQAKGAKPDPVELRWTTNPDGALFQLKLKTGATLQKTFVSARPSFSLFRLEAPFTVSVDLRSYDEKSVGPRDQKRKKMLKNKVSPQALHRLDPNLLIIKPMIMTPPKSEPQGPVVTELTPLPPPPAEVKLVEDEATLDTSMFETRLSEIVFSLYTGKEKIYASKQATFLVSKRPVTGMAMDARLVPVTGLEVMGRVSGHGVETHSKDSNGTTVRDQNMSLYRGEAGLGFDLFFRNPNRRHRWTIEVRGALMNMPHIAVNAEDLIKNEYVMSTAQMVGIGSVYRWSVNRWSLALEAVKYEQSTDKSQDNNSAMEEISGFVSIDPWPSVTLRLGGASRLSRIVRCSSQKEACTSDGNAATRVLTQVGSFGIGYVIN